MDRVIANADVESEVPIIARILNLVLWNIPAIPSPIETRFNPKQPKRNNPNITAAAESVSIPPGTVASQAPATKKIKKISNMLNIAITREAIPSLD
jgi:hypothetical protein